MEAKYKAGEEVIVKPCPSQSSLRDSSLGQYVGQTGHVTRSFWISPLAGQIFYLYTVQFTPYGKEIVLHEDEIESILPSS